MDYPPRTFTFTIPAPVGRVPVKRRVAGKTVKVHVLAPLWLNANDRIHHRVRHERVLAWRTATIAAARTADIPRNLGLDLVRIDATLHFTRAARRDRSNFNPTVKAIVDALTPHRVHRRNNKITTFPGIGLILDDNDKIVDGPVLAIADTPLPPDCPYLGMVTLTVTVRHGCTTRPVPPPTL